MELKFKNRNPDEPSSTVIATFNNKKVFSLEYIPTRPNKYGYYSLNPNLNEINIDLSECLDKQYDTIEEAKQKANELFEKYKNR